MSEGGYAHLVTAAHNQLHAPMILVWDNLNTHISAAMRRFIEAPGLADRSPAALAGSAASPATTDRWARSLTPHGGKRVLGPLPGGPIGTIRRY
jgi:hypothetical protein